MNIILNGENFSIENEASVSSLAEKLHLDIRKIAIERNMAIIPRSEYQATILNDNDIVEIVSFIGGG